MPPTDIEFEYLFSLPKFLPKEDDASGPLILTLSGFYERVSSLFLLSTVGIFSCCATSPKTDFPLPLNWPTPGV